MATALIDGVIDELQGICGQDHVFTGRSALFNRARVPAPFPAHRWAEHIPQAVVLPTSAQQVSEVVKLANAHGIPVVPRAGGTGLTDRAVLLRHGILALRSLCTRHTSLPRRSRSMRSWRRVLGQERHLAAAASVRADTIDAVDLVELVARTAGLSSDAVV